MNVFRTISPSYPHAPCALAIGNFDGVHVGHQALLAEVKNAAERLHIKAMVMTFEPHPREFFALQKNIPSMAPTRIANLRDTLNSFKNAGMDSVFVQHFNARFANQSPQEFIKNVLVDGLNVRWLMVGEDFCFGAKRAGNVAMLKQAGQQLGFEVATLPTVTTQDANPKRISSSAVRVALSQGDFAQTQALLGHPYFISGRVIHGQKLGRTIGFPTLNIRIKHQQPAVHGVFIVQVHGLAAQPLPAVASLGNRPTVTNAGRVLLEVHIFDYQVDCYGKLVQIEFLQKIRPEAKFDDIQAMTAAIWQDAQQARDYFAARATLVNPSIQPIQTMSATDRI